MPHSTGPIPLAGMCVLAVLSSVGLTSCSAGQPEPATTLHPPSAAPITAATRSEATPPDRRAEQTRSVSHVVRHWFGRYRKKYSEIVRIETLVAHVDSPTRADAFVVASFADAGSDHAHRQRARERPRAGRYYRTVQLKRRHGRWHIEAVRPT